MRRIAIADVKALAIAVVTACCGGQVEAQPVQTNSARNCAVCHLQWMDAFSDPAASPLIPRPSRPAVAEPETCFGCHDGSVGDSRRRVWLEHGHRYGVTPPADMKISSKLPLDDGKIACLTCHTAHAGRGPETIATAIFQRFNNQRSELCLACHQDRGGTDSDDGRMHDHPLVDMDQPVPNSLLGGFARFGPEQKSVTCQSCHTPHGGQSDFLLIQESGADGNCVACHQAATPQLETSLSAHHPLRVALTDGARDAVSKWHPDLAAADTLNCRSCHAMHDSKSTDQLLVEPLENSVLCLSCHSSFDSIAESPHDLRVSAPQEQNAADLTAERSGQCGACHMVHQSARNLNDQAAMDYASRMNQRCTTCHAVGECGESAGGLTLHHSAGGGADDAVHCLRCHNPHDTTHPRFLRESPDAVCAQCHTDQAANLAGGHTFASQPDIQNALGRTVDQAGQCGFCHSVHDARGPMLWAATSDSPESADGLCTTCHQQGEIAGDLVPPPMRHPRDVPANSPMISAIRAASMPLFDTAGHHAESGSIACGTCHDPHGGANASAALLRGEEQSLCLTCHTSMALIKDSPHGAASLAKSMHGAHLDLNPASCGPCHAVHQVGDQPALWAGPTDASARLEDARRCYGCHDSSRIKLPRHPPIPIGGGGGDLPVVEGGGAPAGMAWISCDTCHQPHSREILHSNSDRANDGNSASPDMIRAGKPMLREYQPPNTCSHCHGFDGLIRFLRYHEIAQNSP